MVKFTLRRVVQIIPVLFVVASLTFFLVRTAPGGPFDAEKAIEPEIMEQLKVYYHMDGTLFEQYSYYMKNLVFNLDFGPSTKNVGRSVNEIIISGLPYTAELAFYAIIISLLIGIFAGIIASLKPNTRQDYIPMSLAMVGVCLPSFLMGPTLVLVFALWFEWFPVSGWNSMAHKVLPSLTLGLYYAAYVARLTRGGMLEVMNLDYIRTARAKGVSERNVIIKHAIRGGILPVVSFMGPAVSGMLAGSFVVETIFQIPGIGRFFVQSAFNRDYSLIMGMTIFFTAILVTFNFLTDVVHVWLNPRLRSQLGDH